MIGALRKRTSAEREAAASEERAGQLALYRTELQETVARRTEELAQANTDLELQLVERRSAEVALRQHDALLSAVTKSAAELLGSHSLETPIASVLELIGKTLCVCRVHLAEIVASNDGRFRSLLRNEWWASDISPLMDDPGFQNVDLTAAFPKLIERKIAEQEIALLARTRTDSLTGLANRATFLERLGREFAAAARGSKPFAIMYLDLDRFKPVNDSLGHAAGDERLRVVADRLTSCIRETDLVARLGGDEFAVLQTDVAEPASAGVLAAKIQELLAQPYRLNGTWVEISASIGISPYSPSCTGPEAMLGQADLALYRSKVEGRNRFHFHSENLDQEVLERVTLSEDLKAAIEDGKLEIYCEPQVALSTAEFSGLKALVRWHHPSRGLLTSSELLPMVQKTGNGMAFGRFLLDGACRELRQRRNIGSAPPVVAIDAHLCQLHNAGEFLRDVRSALERWDLVPSDLELDVTEATFAQLTLANNDTLHRACELGVKIALADFGSECSSFETYGRTAWLASKYLMSSTLIRSSRPIERLQSTPRCGLRKGLVSKSLQNDSRRKNTAPR